MERKLASIQMIEEIAPIEDADRIEMVRVLGWRCVARKGEFQAGDRCVYFEIDSVLPDEPWCSFLGDDHRIRTRRFRGQISQGLALPVASTIDSREFDASALEVGDDVSAVLSVNKYERPEPGGWDAAGPFPLHYVISKTDEMRLQSVPGVLNEMRGLPWVATEKIDGASMSVIFAEDETIVCSRNVAIKDGDNWYWNACKRYDVDRLRGCGVALQGEVFGRGVGKNRLGLKELHFAIFDVFDLKARAYSGHRGIGDHAVLLKIPAVRTVASGDCFDETVDSMVRMSRGVYENGTPREGIVVRPTSVVQSRVLGGRLSFKVVNPDYLLKYGE